MIFEYFVFSTVYIQNIFSGVHPARLLVRRDEYMTVQLWWRHGHDSNTWSMD